MDLLEYQARECFASWGIPTPLAIVAATTDDAEQAASQLIANGATGVVVKAQVPTGGRGKSGGVAVVADAQAAREAAVRILNQPIATHRVECLLVAEAVDIAEEYYAAVLLDRDAGGYRALFCAEGGVDIETIAKNSPDALLQQAINPLDGFDVDAALAFLQPAALPAPVRAQAAEALAKCYQLLREGDATLVEINPLARTTSDQVIALDAKITLDDNAAFRHPERAHLYAADRIRDPNERAASEAGLNYVKLDGEIGIIGNGAGLVLSTLDIVTTAGEAAGIRPANFLDIGGGASTETMVTALRVVLGDPQVRSIFINIYGGITACDLIARGMLEALESLATGNETGTEIKPIVVRFDGNAAEAGLAILQQAAHPAVTVCDTMHTAAETVVALATAREER